MLLNHTAKIPCPIVANCWAIIDCPRLATRLTQETLRHRDSLHNKHPGAGRAILNENEPAMDKRPQKPVHWGPDLVSPDPPLPITESGLYGYLERLLFAALAFLGGKD